MAQKKSESRYFSSETEIDYTCCKQMSMHNQTQTNILFLILLLLATLYMLYKVFGPSEGRWHGLFAVVIAWAWFFRTRSLGSKLYGRIVSPSGLDYLQRSMMIDRTGITEVEKETGRPNKYSFEQVDNLTMTKDYLMIFLKDGQIKPVELRYLKGGTPTQLEEYLIRRCPALAGGEKSTGGGVFVCCVILTAIDLFAWLGLIALAIIGI